MSDTTMRLRLLVFILSVGILALLVPRFITALHARSLLYEPINVPPEGVAIVFGAGLRRDGTPSPILRDRIGKAAELYFQGKVEKLLMSGDNRFVDYNEPGAMREYAIDLGIPPEAIILDFAGRRTYDTCYRARDVFGISSAVLVTQRFHLPRALYTCNLLGVPAVGVPAEPARFRRGPALYWNLREIPATFRAFWDLYVTKPVPVLGEPIPIHTQTEAYRFRKNQVLIGSALEGI